MPELPEVETTLRGIAPYLVGRTVQAVTVRQRQLRWPVPAALLSELPGHRIEDVTRRAKYLLLKAEAGTVIIHLGMSGSLRLLSPDTPPTPHDHVDIVLGTSHCLRLRDPRRFGCVLWTRTNPERHRLLRALGPEPLSADFNAEYLFRQSRGRVCAIKAFIMNSRIVVGVGNIYACEALFRSGIHPGRGAGRIALGRYGRLASSIKSTLSEAIDAGGTTLQDFVGSDGKPGYFRPALLVYGQAGGPCPNCGLPIRKQVRNQRSSFYCPRCQH